MEPKVGEIYSWSSENNDNYCVYYIVKASRFDERKYIKVLESSYVSLNKEPFLYTVGTCSKNITPNLNKLLFIGE